MKTPIWTTLIILFSLVAGTVGERASSYLLMVLVMIILMTITVTMVMIADELVKDVYFRWEKVLPKRVLFNLSL